MSHLLLRQPQRLRSLVDSLCICARARTVVQGGSWEDDGLLEKQGRVFEIRSPPRNRYNGLQTKTLFVFFSFSNVLLQTTRSVKMYSRRLFARVVANMTLYVLWQ